jgi:hypothetical protein
LISELFRRVKDLESRQQGLFIPKASIAFDFDDGSAAVFTNGTFADLDALTGSPLGSAVAVTVTHGARILVMLSAQLNHQSGGQYVMASVRLSGSNTVTPSDSWSIVNGVSAAGEYATVSRQRVFAGLTPGTTTVEMVARVSGGTGELHRPNLVVIPLN